jgi:hypothetical protein
MSREEFLQKMLAKGKVTQAQIDKANKKGEALKKHKSEKS